MHTGLNVVVVVGGGGWCGSDGGGVVVDGFPRTMVQALTIKLLFDQMKILRDIHINDPVLKNKFR